MSVEDDIMDDGPKKQPQQQKKQNNKNKNNKNKNDEIKCSNTNSCACAMCTRLKAAVAANEEKNNNTTNKNNTNKDVSPKNNAPLKKKKQQTEDEDSYGETEKKKNEKKKKGNEIVSGKITPPKKKGNEPSKDKQLAADALVQNNPVLNNQYVFNLKTGKIYDEFNIIRKPRVTREFLEGMKVDDLAKFAGKEGLKKGKRTKGELVDHILTSLNPTDAEKEALDSFISEVDASSHDEKSHHDFYRVRYHFSLNHFFFSVSVF